MDKIKEKLLEREFKMITYANELNNKKNILFESSPENTVIDPSIDYFKEEELCDKILSYITNKKEKLSEVLKYEMSKYNFYNYSIKNNIELSEKLFYLFNRYNHTVFNITEDNWVLYKYDNLQKKYELKEGEFVLDNSILIKDKKDQSLILCLKNLINISNILCNKIDYQLTTKFYDDKYHQICWLIFVYSKK